MPLRLIFSRMWRERYAMVTMLVAICLITGFLALGPLYARATAEVAAKHLIASAGPEQLNVTFTNPAPWEPSLWEDAIVPHLGRFVTEGFRYVIGAGSDQGMVCGFEYIPGVPLTEDTPRTLLTQCYQPVSYAQPEALFTLVDGRWPHALDPAEAPEAPQAEAVLAAEAAEKAGMSIGDRFVIGTTLEALTVEVVGLVEPSLPPDDAFWNGQRIVLTGVWTTVGLERRFDIAPVFDRVVYDTQIAPLAESKVYFWRLRTDRDALAGSTLEALDARLQRAEAQMRLHHPKIKRLSGLDDLIAQFKADVRAVQPPVLTLSGMILVLMLYNLATIGGLVLARQQIEWATMSGRGASATQLLWIQFVTSVLLGAAGFVLGLPVAVVFLSLLVWGGPLAGSGLQTSVPLESVGLSLVAAAAAALALSLLAWSAARQSVEALYQHRSRPPVRMAWVRYFIDIVFLLVGTAFVLRLYILAAGDVGAGLHMLLSDPAALFRQHGGRFNEPFDLVGPVLLVVGAALFWLRLFPLLMGTVGRLIRRRRGLTAPLALWNVARDPGHYARLVLLLIGTLALGTASLAVRATHDAGTWERALHETGAHVSAAFAPGDTMAWETLPGVVEAASLMYVEETRPAEKSRLTLLGIGPETLGLLESAALPPREGLLLPEDAETLTLEIYVEDETGAIDLRLGLALVDARGVLREAPLTVAHSPAPFATYRASLQGLDGTAPWYLTGVYIRPTHRTETEFEQTLYFDELVAHSPDAAVVIEDFEGTPSAWTLSINQNSRLMIMKNTHTALAAEGSGSLRIRYRATLAYPEPFIAVAQRGAPRVSVVVSRAFAAHVGRLTNDPPLKPGDLRSVDLAMPFGNMKFSYSVVGVIDEVPSQSKEDFFLIAPAEALRVALNREAPSDMVYDWNRAWLTLDEKKPKETLRAALEAESGVEPSYAWDRYQLIQREPLPNIISGMLFAGFWVSLGLAVLDFGVYLAISARQRSRTFAVLQAMGWDARHIWGLLAAEQAAMVIPALLVGVGLGVVLAYFLLPFLALAGAIQMPIGNLAALLLALLCAFGALLSWTAWVLRRRGAFEALRFGRE